MSPEPTDAELAAWARGCAERSWPCIGPTEIAMLTTIAARLERPAVEGWQPMETAPRDETRVLVCWAGESDVDIRRWSTETSRWEDDDNWGYESLFPLRWMPLPKPLVTIKPAAAGGG